MSVERFGYNRAWKFQGFWACGYPVIALVGLAALSTIDIIRFKWWVPLFVIALIIWLVYGLIKAIQRLQFAVTITDESIQIGGQGAVKWSEIERAELGAAIGNDPAIKLHTSSGQVVGVPGTTASLPYIAGIVKKHVSNISEER